MKYLLSTLAVIALSAGTLSAGARLKVPEAEFNFGKAPQNGTVSHTFWLHSAGDDTLRITKIVPGCGCTKAPLEDSVLAPGDSTRIEILFETGRYGGYVTKKPYIETNMGEEKTLLTINTHVLTNPDSALPLVITPARLDVSQFSETPRRRGTFTIQNRSAKPYTLRLVDYPVDYYTVSLPAEIPAGGSVTGEIEVVADKIAADFERSLTFEINDEVRTRYSVPVKRMYRLKDRADAGK